MLLKKELGVVEDSYYEATVTRPPPHPPLAERVRADVCVVGAGYAGLSAALELAQRGYSVVVLEAQRAGWGASGRNGGQVIVGFGSDGECAIERQFPREDARRAWDVTVDGIALLHERAPRPRDRLRLAAGVPEPRDQAAQDGRAAALDGPRGACVHLGEYGDAVAPEVSSRIMPVGTYMIATEPLGRERADALMPQRSAASDTCERCARPGAGTNPAVRWSRVRPPPGARSAW